MEKEEFEINLDNTFENYQCIKNHYYSNIVDISSLIEHPEFLKKLEEIINYEEISDDPKSMKLEQMPPMENLEVIAQENDQGFIYYFLK